MMNSVENLAGRESQISSDRVELCQTNDQQTTCLPFVVR